MPHRNTPPSLLLLAAVCLSTAHAAPPNDEAVEKRLLAAAQTSSDTYFSVESNRPGLAADDLIAFRGFFISADGLAVVPLQAFDHGQFNATLDTNKAPLTIAGVVAADLGTGLAIVRTDQKPLHWLRLAKDDLPVGERVGIYRAEDQGGSVTAPILARRKVAQTRSRTYQEMLSLGVNLGELAGTHVPAGTPIFDSGGQVAGILSQPFVSTRQRFHLAFLSSAIRARLPADANGAPTVPFPLPRTFQPADPLALDPTYLLGRRAQLTGNNIEAERLLNSALAREPKSAAAWERLGFVRRELARDNEALTAFDKAADLGNELAGFQLNRADQLRLMNQLDKATEVLQAACIMIPHDYDLHRAFAVALRLKKDEMGAEYQLRHAVKLAPDVISCWELLSKCLGAQGKWDIEKLASNNIYKLEALYRPR